MARTKNKYIWDKFGQVIGKIEVKDDNPYKVLGRKKMRKERRQH